MHSLQLLHTVLQGSAQQFTGPQSLELPLYYDEDGKLREVDSH